MAVQQRCGRSQAFTSESMLLMASAMCLFRCRALEMLDQLDLCESLFDHGCYTKDGFNYRNGVSVPGG